MGLCLVDVEPGSCGFSTTTSSGVYGIGKRLEVPSGRSRSKEKKNEKNEAKKKNEGDKGSLSLCN